MAKHGVATISTTTAGAGVRTCAADLSRARHQSVFDAAMAPAQESGLRENCTSRLSERAEAGRTLDLSRLYSYEAGEQSERAHCGGIYRGKRSGAGGAKGGGQGECAPAKHALDSEPGSRVTGAGAYTASNCRHTPEVGEAMGRVAEVVARQTAIDTQGHRGGYRDNWNSVVGFQLWANKTIRFGGTSRDPKPERPHY